MITIICCQDRNVYLFDVAKRVMKRMIKESSESEFEFSENDTVAMSKNGWVRI